MIPHPCAMCEQIPTLHKPETVNNSGPAKGVKISKAWVSCVCGWKGPDMMTETQAINAWNLVMGHALTRVYTIRDEDDK